MDGSINSGFSEYRSEKRADDKEKKNKTPQRDMIIETVITNGAEFWRDPDGTAYVTLPREGRMERYRVRSGAFRSVIRALYAERNLRQTDEGLLLPGSISDKAMAEALPALEAMVLRADTTTREPGLRSIKIGNTVWIDLGTPDWSLIKVTKEGWEIVPVADVPLIRAEAMRPLPMPDRAAAQGAMKHLRSLLNLSDERTDDFILVASWLLAALWPTGPYPVLGVDGEQGSGKTTLSRLLRNIVDPNKAPLRAPPRKEDDLIVAANAGRVIAVDNVSVIDSDMADVICRLATGAGLSKRRLYTDDEEHIIHVCRPVLLNGITSLMARGDLADRSIVVTLPRIPDDRRLTEAEIEREFEDAAPGILAALLDGMVSALSADDCGDRKRRGDLPRMADFANLAMNAAPAFGWRPDVVLEAIKRNRHAANIAVVEADPLANALHLVLDQHGSARPEGDRWEGTASELLEKANLLISDSVRRDRSWPKDATRLSGGLRRLAPALRRCGVDIQLPDGGGRRGRQLVIQRSQRSQRSPQENAEETPSAGSGTSVPEDLDQRSENGCNVPQRSVIPLKTNDTEPWNAGNADSPDIALGEDAELTL